MPPPYRRRYARRRRGASRQLRAKRAYKRRSARYSRKPKSGLPSSINRTPFPATMYKALTYNTAPITLSTGTPGLVVAYQFRGNSLFDPDLTGAGSQPKYFDTFCGAGDGTTSAPYGSYAVLASKITIDIFPDPQLASANNLFRVFCIPLRGGSTATNVPANWVDIAERPYIRYKDFGNSGAVNKGRITAYCKTKSLFSGMAIQDNDFVAGYNANPTNVWRWVIGIINTQPTGAPSCLFSAKITYYVQFSNMNQVVTS